MAAARAIAAARARRARGDLAPGDPRGHASERRTARSRRSAGARRPSPRASEYGAYVVAALRGDPDGPRPQAGPVLHADRGDAVGRGRRRAAVPAARVQRAREPRRAATSSQFLIEDVGPGTNRLCELGAGDELLLVGPLGHRLRRAPRRPPPAARRRRGRDRAAGDLAGRSSRRRDAALLGFRDAAHAERRRAAGGRRDRDRRRQRRPPRARDRAARRRARRRRRMPRSTPAGRRRCSRRSGRCCAERDVPAQLALESGMACGFGACFGCVVPTRSGYVRLCVDGPVLDAAATGVRGRMIDRSAGSSSRTRSSTARGRSTRSPPSARSATSCSSGSRSRRSSRRRSRSSRARAIRRRGCGSSPAA